MPLTEENNIYDTPVQCLSPSSINVTQISQPVQVGSYKNLHQFFHQSMSLPTTYKGTSFHKPTVIGRALD